MLLISGAAGLSWRAIRRGDVPAHRRWIHRAGWLIVLFVVGYLVKVLAMGREGALAWPFWDQVVLRVHEGFVALMLIAGISARWLARRYPWPPAAASVPSEASRQWLQVRERHRRWGRLAMITCALVMLTGVMILIGMFLRA